MSQNYGMNLKDLKMESAFIRSDFPGQS
ncbi:hypothetical protein PO124_24305 [Bacillus licheniformis]|nr:hypothetical protein [Bacillus licheniformis]